ncbi:hypothetical protein ACFU3E_15695 [Streptomyces sp. NPDC057424]|uniref:hypothetical protein n=1 Tax=Streptomyces sp. NPDC057424 TaxID=3346127 RepID=UPI0036B5BACB
MSWSAALPDAALRTLRTAAGRRALQVTLLLAGLLVFGLLSEERAHAENGGGALPEGRAGQTVGVHIPGGSGHRLARSAGAVGEAVGEGLPDTRVEVPPSSSLRSQQPRRPSRAEQPPHVEHPELPTQPTHPVLPKPPSGPVLPKPPSGPVLPDLPPLPHLPVTADMPAPPSLPGLSGSPGLTALPGLSGSPALPALPGHPQSPGLPVLPGPPESPGLPGLPGLPAPPGSDVAHPEAPALPAFPGFPSNPELPGRPLPVPVTADPQRGGTTAPTAGGTGSPRRPGTPGPPAHGKEPYAVHAGPMVSDPHTHHVRHGAHANLADHTSRPGRPDRPDRPEPSTHAGRTTTAGHASGGRPDGALGSRFLADNGSPRHGDAHAVTPSPGAPLRLVPGAAGRALAGGARCGHRDVPLFPG